MIRSIVSGLFLAFALVTSAGCGATVGDPCTTPKDCGSGLCLNQESTPGGYCTQQCIPADRESCPEGTICVNLRDDKTLSAACFLRCTRDDDCRAGYTCRQSERWPDRICLGPGDL